MSPQTTITAAATAVAADGSSTERPEAVCQRERQQKNPDGNVEGRGLVQVPLRLHNDPMKCRAAKAHPPESDPQHPREEQGAFVRVESKNRREQTAHTSPPNAEIVAR